MQQLIPRDKERTESRFWLQHKIVTAVDAFVCFVNFYERAGWRSTCVTPLPNSLGSKRQEEKSEVEINEASVSIVLKSF